MQGLICAQEESRGGKETGLLLCVPSSCAPYRPLLERWELGSGGGLGVLGGFLKEAPCEAAFFSHSHCPAHLGDLLCLSGVL